MRKDPIKITNAKGQMNKKCFVEIKLQFFQQYISLSFQQPGFTWISYVRQPFCWVLADLKHDTIVDNTAQKINQWKKNMVISHQSYYLSKIGFLVNSVAVVGFRRGGGREENSEKENLVLQSSKNYCVISLSSFKIFF